jgi:hypothetical protein
LHVEGRKGFGRIEERKIGRDDIRHVRKSRMLSSPDVNGFAIDGRLHRRTIEGMTRSERIPEPIWLNGRATTASRRTFGK